MKKAQQLRQDMGLIKTNNRELQIACAKLHKAYLREHNSKSFDMRAFEFFDKRKQFTKITNLINALKFIELNKDENKAKELIIKSNCNAIENGIYFIRELLSK